MNKQRNHNGNSTGVVNSFRGGIQSSNIERANIPKLMDIYIPKAVELNLKWVKFVNNEQYCQQFFGGRKRGADNQNGGVAKKQRMQTRRSGEDSLLIPTVRVSEFETPIRTQASSSTMSSGVGTGNIPEPAIQLNPKTPRGWKFPTVDDMIAAAKELDNLQIADK